MEPNPPFGKVEPNIYKGVCICIFQHFLTKDLVVPFVKVQVDLVPGTTDKYIMWHVMRNTPIRTFLYIVCKKFIFPSNAGFITKLTGCFVNVLKSTTPIHRFLSCPIATHFINKLEEFNAIFGQQQIDNIQQTIILIDNKHKNDKIDVYIRNNIQKCTNWCIAHNVPHNVFVRSAWD